MLIARLLRRFEAFLLARPLDEIEESAPLVFDTVEPDAFRAWAMLHAGSTATGFVEDESFTADESDLIND